MTTWYAQNGSQNIDAAWSGHDTMWNDAANGSGNWLTWSNLGVNDVLNANSKSSININVDTVICERLTTVGTSGGFIVSTTRVIGTPSFRTSIYAGSSTNCLTFAANSIFVTLYGDVYGGGASNKYGIYSASYTNIILYIYGNVTGGTGGTTAAGVYFLAAATPATIYVSGNITGGTGAVTSNGMRIDSAIASIIVDGNCSGGGPSGSNQNSGLYLVGANAVATINGDVIAGTGLNMWGACANTITSLITIKGNIINSASCVAVNGTVVYMPNPGKYIQFGSNKYPLQLTPAQVLAGTVHGDLTGTLAAANRLRGLVA